MVINKGEDIGLTLQLINNNGTFKEDAIVTYRIFDSTGVLELVSEQTATYNTTTKSYIDTLDPSVLWTNQEVGSYLIIWSVTNADDFASIYTEDLQINIDKTKIDKILGLVHQNIYMDNTSYDNANNLISCRIRIYSNSTDVGTDINVISTYNVTATTNDIAGKFVTWKQLEV
jgi:hypothetical protein